MARGRRWAGETGGTMAASMRLAAGGVAECPGRDSEPPGEGLDEVRGLAVAHQPRASVTVSGWWASSSAALRNLTARRWAANVVRPISS